MSPRVVIGQAVPDTAMLDNEIARLRGLDIGELQARWHTVFGRRAPPHLPRHLLFRMLAYRLQADRLGELDADSRRLLDRIGSGSSEGINRLVADFNRPRRSDGLFHQCGHLLRNGGRCAVAFRHQVLAHQRKRDTVLI